MGDHGTFYWNELLTDDVGTATKFYRSVLGWTTEEMPMPSGEKYIVVKANGKPAGGIMDKAHTGAKDAPSHWAAYIQVADVDAAVAQAGKAGGKVLQPCFDVPGVGRIAVLQDPTGAVIGIMTPAPAQS
ncbi:MAG: VOC family protein [Rhodospirillaceae bacterium]|nr:VOC family protein [Rhodospirillaceae bacterium]